MIVLGLCDSTDMRTAIEDDHEDDDEDDAQEQLSARIAGAQ